MISVLMGAVWMACGGQTGDTGDGIMISGIIEPDGQGVSGEVSASTAVAFDQDGVLLVYISSNPASTCTNISEYLMAGAVVDPVDVLSPGMCNIYIRMGSGYEGSYSGVDDMVVGAGTSISCYMDEGEWIYEERDEDDLDYFWSGREWQGSPSAFSYDFSGGGGEDYILEIEMSAYNGNFIYEGFKNQGPASGTVIGTAQATWCPDLGQTGLY